MCLFGTHRVFWARLEHVFGQHMPVPVCGVIMCMLMPRSSQYDAPGQVKAATLYSVYIDLKYWLLRLRLGSRCL